MISAFFVVVELLEEFALDLVTESSCYHFSVFVDGAFNWRGAIFGSYELVDVLEEVLRGLFDSVDCFKLDHCVLVLMCLFKFFLAQL